MIPGVWTNSTEYYFADSITCTNGFEVLVMELSGPYDVEYIEHPLGDIWKLIKLMTISLHDEVLKVQDGSYETAKKLATFGVQCIRDRLTLLKTSIYDINRFQVVEPRSASMPVTWEDKSDLLAVFELLSTLNVSSPRTELKFTNRRSRIYFVNKAAFNSSLKRVYFSCRLYYH